MLRQLYDRTLALATHRHAIWFLAIIAFFESSIFPIPPDLIMIPMILAAPSRAWKIASVCLVASVLGGVLGYAIGVYAFSEVGRPLLELLGKSGEMASFNQQFVDVGFWAVLAAGLTPFPYKVITIMSGWTGLPMTIFLLASVISRGLRFFLVAALLWKYGEPIRHFVEKRLGLVFAAIILLLFLTYGASGLL